MATVQSTIKLTLLLALASTTHGQGGAAVATTYAYIPPQSPAACRVEAYAISGINWLRQTLVEIRLPRGCPLNQGRLARVITGHGGKLPPYGFWKLGYGSPRSLRLWVFKGARVQDRAAPNVWRDVPIQGAWWQ